MTDKDERRITNAMLGKMTFGVLDILLEYVRHMEKTAYKEGYSAGYSEGMKDPSGLHKPG
ncbi:hypothetical protein LCGC14_1913690 [marine sediment metagenome]|uniref:Uncharacterized protein n=1 Tax=marine sediment metagenome TaxID=412755 RepID=A0A0F9I6W5_9ZZZZ